MLLHTPKCNNGWVAPRFKLKGVDGKIYTLNDVKGKNGTLVMFICNHCPYVKGIMDRLPDTIRKLKEHGIGVVAINANDANEYPDDSFENMIEFSLKNGLSCPYLYDETQTVALDYDAICTPDFFGFNSKLELEYRGRLDSSGKDLANETTVPELYNAMLEIAKKGKTSTKQYPSMGCSIKWKQEDSIA